MWRSAEGWRRAAYRHGRRSELLTAARQWEQAWHSNQRALDAIERAVAMTTTFPDDEKLMASLYFNQAGLKEYLGDLRGALKSAQRALQLYDRLDPTLGHVEKIEPVLKAARRPAVVTDVRRLRATVEANADHEYATEQAIAHHANAAARAVRLDAVTYGNIKTADPIRESRDWAVSVYRELLRVGVHHTPADLARIEAEFAEALKSQRGEPHGFSR